MAKKKSRKKKELILLIRIPDAESRNGKATLTIQRGELGHMSEFDYKGLTLKGNIAEAVGTALTQLKGVESNPPPEISAETSQSVSTVTDRKLTPKTASEDEKSVSSVLTVEDDNDPQNPAETGKKGENTPENPSEPPKSGVKTGVSTETDRTDTDTSEEAESVPKAPKKLSVSVVSKTPDTSTDTQQMSMF
jgi:hypothetical protein